MVLQIAEIVLIFVALRVILAQSFTIYMSTRKAVLRLLERSNG